MPIRHPMSKLYYVMFFPLTQGSTALEVRDRLTRTSPRTMLSCTTFEPVKVPIILLMALYWYFTCCYKKFASHNHTHDGSQNCQK